MIVAAVLSALIVAGAVAHTCDERLMRTSWYPRLTTWLLGPAEDQPQLAPVTQLPTSNVRVHCRACGGIDPIHNQGCGPLDRLDAPRPQEQHQ